MEKKFAKAFNQKGKVKEYKINEEFKATAKVSQQSLEKAVEDEIQKLLKAGHISKVEKLQMTFSYYQ